VIELAPEDLISAAGFFGVLLILAGLSEIGIGTYVHKNRVGEQHHGMGPGSWWLGGGGGGGGGLFAIPPGVLASIMSYVLYDDEQRSVAIYCTYLIGRVVSGCGRFCWHSQWLSLAMSLSLK
jgi:hypothetical protein